IALEMKNCRGGAWRDRGFIVSPPPAPKLLPGDLETLDLLRERRREERLERQAQAARDAQLRESIEQFQEQIRMQPILENFENKVRTIPDDEHRKDPSGDYYMVVVAVPEYDQKYAVKYTIFDPNARFLTPLTALFEPRSYQAACIKKARDGTFKRPVEISDAWGMAMPDSAIWRQKTDQYNTENDIYHKLLRMEGPL